MFGKQWIWKDVDITGVSDNSQRIRQGEVFVCRGGSKNDGRAYAEDAVKKGAAAVVSYMDMELCVPVLCTEDIQKTAAELSEKFYLPDGRSFGLIGVTGTNGKTTVTHIIKDILESRGKRVGLIGTNGVFVNGERAKLYTSTPTTPGAVELWRIFAAMERVKTDFVVMEVSSHALALGRVLGCEFDVGVFTNLTRDHLDFHKTMKEYADAKRKLFEISKKAVINIDDMTGRTIYSGFCGEKLSVGADDADITWAALSMKENGSDFLAQYHGKSVPVRLSLPGKFNVYNALSAAGACVLLGIDFSAAAEGLAFAKPVKGRMEKVTGGYGFTVIIDYAHTPDGLEKIIHTAKGFARGRVITLFGCGGDRDRTKRAVMGGISGKFSDYTVITSDNPRTEEPFCVIADIYEGIKDTKGEYCIIPDRKMAIGHALSIAREGDVVLLAGKGQEDYQIIGNEKIHFDEREIVDEYMKNRRDK